MSIGPEKRRRAQERASRALPRIRLVQPLNVPDGTPLNIRMAAKTVSPLVDTEAIGLPVMRATSGVFGVTYVVDEGHQFTSVDESELEASGFTLDDLHQTSMKNLRELVANAKPGLRLQHLPAQDGQGEAIMLVLDGDNEASMMLLDELWDDALHKHIPNGVMAVIPARDVCAFIDLKAVTNGGLGDLLNVVANVHNRQGHAFPDLMHRVDGRWTKAGEVTGLEALKPA